MQAHEKIKVGEQISEAVEHQIIITSFGISDAGSPNLSEENAMLRVIHEKALDA